MSDSETSTPVTPARQDSSQTTSSEASGGRSENGDAGTGRPAGSALLHSQFKAFAKFGDSKSDGAAITLSQSDKWMKQAKVIDGKTVTTTDTGIAFKKFKQQKIHFKEFQKYLDELADSKKIPPSKMNEKLANCGSPGTKQMSSPGAAKSSVYDRLCDVSKYGASHRQRFDAHGRGRGAVGRREMKTDSGYVSGYKNQNTYPEKQ